MNLIFDLWEQAITLWQKGGILMPTLAALSLYTYFIAFDLWFRLRNILPKDIKSFPREKWGAFQDGGRVNHVIRYCIGNHNDRNETKKDLNK